MNNKLFDYTRLECKESEIVRMYEDGIKLYIMAGNRGSFMSIDNISVLFGHLAKNVPVYAREEVQWQELIRKRIDDGRMLPVYFDTNELIASLQYDFDTTEFIDFCKFVIETTKDLNIK